MASPISTLSICSSSARNCKSTMYSIPSCSTSASVYLKTLNFSPLSSFSQLGLSHFSPWSGLKHTGISISLKSRKFGNRGKCKGKGVYASLFGVGAPEALVIGVVALLVFGPKGLAELARNLGKTLRTFQPTIRELQEVSKEFKSALEREISLDDDPSPVNTMNGSNNPNITSSESVSNFGESQTSSVADPNGALAPNNAYSLEESLKGNEEQYKAITTVDQDITSEIDTQPQDIATSSSAYTSEEYLKITEEQLKAFATTQQTASSPPSENQTEIERPPQATVEEVTTTTPPVEKTESEK